MNTSSALSFQSIFAGIMETHAKHRGFHDLALVDHWQDILPTSLSRWIAPQRMRKAAGGKNELIIGVVPAKITEMTYFGDMIKHEINDFFSFGMVDTVSFVADDSLGFLDISPFLKK